MEALTQQDSQLDTKVGDEDFLDHDATNIVDFFILAMGIYDFQLIERLVRRIGL
jgi:hypothetical protein